MIELYGIANCDTVKKARNWLAEHQLEYQFHDFKKKPPTQAQLSNWCKALGWEVLVNRRGTTWRKLDENQKEGINQTKAIALMLANPSLIKRPLLQQGSSWLVGFDEAQYQQLG